jgi:hypothetical protein
VKPHTSGIAGAIAVKVALQALTYPAFQARFGDSRTALGAYLGVQTVLFEVGGAFLISAWAVSRCKLNGEDAEGYGLGLAFWENAGRIGMSDAGIRTDNASAHLRIQRQRT